MSLNELIDLYREIEDAIIENLGEVDEVLEEKLFAHSEAVADQLDKCTGYIKYAEGQAAWLKEEAKDLTARAKTMENSVENLRKRMAFLMQATQNAKVKGRHSYSLRDTESWKVRDDIGEYQKQALVQAGLAEFSFKPSVSSIKEYYKGKEVPDFIERAVKTSISIR